MKEIHSPLNICIPPLCFFRWFFKKLFPRSLSLNILEISSHIHQGGLWMQLPCKATLFDIMHFLKPQI